MEERSYLGPDYDDSYHMGDTIEARTGDNLPDDDSSHSSDNLRGFALMISKLLFSLAQL